MSATVHHLFPSPRGTASGTTARTDEPAHPIVESLQAQVRPILMEQLRALFEGADDSLFGMSQRATSADEQRFAFDTMRRLRLERERIEQAFAHALASSFEAQHAPAAEEFDLDRFAIQQTEELEEKIAVGNLATKLETQHRDVLQELQLRIHYLIRHLGVPISRQALSPDSFCNAFKSSLRGLDFALSVRLLLYKLFDQFCASHLGEVYTGVLVLLDRQGIRPAPQAAAPPPAGFGWSPYGPPPAPAESEEPLELPTLDRTTQQALQDVQRQIGGYRPQDAVFAGELLDLADEGQRAPTVARVAPTQRLSLVGQMCNEILSDPHLPPVMRPLFERLRFPLIKIALADGSFFANRAHPVRRLVAEAAETAASSRIASPAVVRRLEERLRHIAEQIDLSASFVRPQLRHLLPLTMVEIAAFLDQQREESETRRENVLNKVRRTVAQELEVHTLGRKPSPGVVLFLRIGWGPLMAARLLRDGMNSRPWIDAINRLVQVLIVMDATDAGPDHLATRERLVDAVAADLLGVGMRDDRIDASIDALRQAYTELDERLATLSPQDREQPSLQLLSPSETAAVMAEFPDPGTPEWRAPAAELARPVLAPELRLEPPPEPPRLPDIDEAPTPPDTAGAAPPAITVPVPPEEAVPSPAASAPGNTGQPSSTEAANGAAAAFHLGTDISDTELLVFVLPAESWFRVFDATRNQTLWLKVSRFYPEHGSVGFTGFDTQQTLSIRAEQFVSDLVNGRSEPVNASPVQNQALAELRRRRQA